MIIDKSERSTTQLDVRNFVLDSDHPPSDEEIETAATHIRKVIKELFFGKGSEQSLITLSEEEWQFIDRMRQKVIAALESLGIENPEQKVPETKETFFYNDAVPNVQGSSGYGSWTVFKIPLGRSILSLQKQIENLYQHESFHNAVMSIITLEESADHQIRMHRRGTNTQKGGLFEVYGFPEEGLANLFPLYCSENENTVLPINYKRTVAFTIAIIKTMVEFSDDYSNDREAYKALARAFIEGDDSIFVKLKVILLSATEGDETTVEQFLEAVSRMSDYEIGIYGAPNNLDETVKLIQTIKGYYARTMNVFNEFNQTISLTGFRGKIRPPIFD